MSIFSKLFGRSDEPGAIRRQIEQARAQNDDATVRRLLESLAKTGDASAQRELGDAYLVATAYDNARVWLEKAAAQGDAEAQHQLGNLYLRGQGVPQNSTTAHEWQE